MEIRKIDCGAELELCPVDEKIGPIKLTVKPIPSDFVLPAETDNQTWINLIGSFIVGWNLTSGGVAVPCNDETKAKYMGYIIRLLVKGEEGQEAEVAAGPIMRFAGNVDNFLKN